MQSGERYFPFSGGPRLELREITTNAPYIVKFYQKTNTPYINGIESKTIAFLKRWQ